MADPDRLAKMYVMNDTVSTRIGLHDKYSVNKYGWGNWVFDQYELKDGMNILELDAGLREFGRAGIAVCPNIQESFFQISLR
jgi:hypothetical protein